MKVRYLVKYTKASEIKFISHLDLMRTIQRIIRRAGLPIEYSKGFNPHMTISIAQPLSVGVYSKGEYMDVVFTEEVDTKLILDKLNENAPNGVKFLDVVKVEKSETGKAPQAMAIIDAAEYVMRLKSTDIKETMKVLEKVKNTPQWDIIKKTKSGEKEVDIKPLVKELKITESENLLVLEVIIACGSRENLSPSLLTDYIKEHIEYIDKEAFVDIERLDMYAYKNNKLVPLNKFF